MYITLNYISIFSPLLTIIAALLLWRYLNYFSTLISILSICSVITELLSVYFVQILKTHNTVVINTYLIFEALLLILICFRQFPISVLKKINLVIGIMILILIFCSAILSSINKYSDFINTAYCLFFVFMALFGFSNQLKYVVFEKAWHNPYFWFNTALLVYFSCTLQLNLFFQYLLSTDKKTLLYFWGVWHSCANIVFYVLITLAVWKAKIYKA